MLLSSILGAAGMPLFLVPVVMRVFKATYKDRKGQTKKSSKWYIEFKSHLDAVCRLPAFTDKKQSESLGRQLEKLAACKISEETLSREMHQWIDVLPVRILKKLVQWNLVDARKAAAIRVIYSHNNWY